MLWKLHITYQTGEPVTLEGGERLLRGVAEALWEDRVNEAVMRLELWNPNGELEDVHEQLAPH